MSEVRRGFDRPIQKALRKYPLEQWTQEVLLETTDYDESLASEVNYIKNFNTTDPNNGYNISSGGEYGASGVKRSEEYKAKMREAKKKSVWRSTPEHGAKISAALKGHPPSDKQKEATRSARAKSFDVRFPDGTVHHINNLSQFAKERGLCVSNLHYSSSKGYRLAK